MWLHRPENFTSSPEPEGLQASVLLGHRVVAAVEKDPKRVGIIATRIRDGCLPDFPIWDDANTFAGAEWRGQVDLVSGGVPCTPFSCAGKRRGSGDERNLWPATLRIVGEVEPREVFFENVPGLLSVREDDGDGLAEGEFFLGTVLGPLARMGFDLGWCRLSASALGATHKRDRLWIYGRRRNTLGVALGDPEGVRLKRCSGRGISGGRGEPDTANPGMADATRLEGRLHARRGDGRGAGDAREAGEVVANALGLGRAGRGGPGDVGGAPRNGPGEAREQRDRDAADDRGDALADAASPRRKRRGLGARPDGSPESESTGGPSAPRDGLPLWPPGPADLSAWARVLAIDPGLAPAVESPVCRVAPGILSRVVRLAALGDAQVPLVAAAAFRYLSRGL